MATTYTKPDAAAALAPNLEPRRPFGQLVRAAHDAFVASLTVADRWGEPYNVKPLDGPTVRPAMWFSMGAS